MRAKPKDAIWSKPDLNIAATKLFGAIAKGVSVFEYGAGGSTIYLAEHASNVVSIEDDKDWHTAILEELDRKELNAVVKLVSTNEIAESIAGEWDVVFVDCRDQIQRAKAIRKASSHVKLGGWLIIDDYNFGPVRSATDDLPSAKWDTTVLSGEKIHPVMKKKVFTQTAFCKRRNDEPLHN